jgi:hypothetical protein
MVSTILRTTIIFASGPALAATHTLASVALIFKEVRVIRVVRIHKAITGRITLDELLGVTTDLRCGASSAHNPVEHFAVLIVEN